MNYIKKTEADIFVTETEEVTKIIQDNYPYMYNDFLKNYPYQENNNHYEYVYEIIDQNRVVGVIFFNLYEDFGLVRYTYILPKYRKKGLFGKYYKKLTKKLQTQVNYTRPIIIDEPTPTIIGSLIKNELATEFRWGITLSHIQLRQKIDNDDALENPYVTTFLYDQELESLIYLGETQTADQDSFILPPNRNTTRNNTTRYQELLEKRERKVIPDSYYKTVNQILHENQVDYQASLGNKQQKHY